MGTAGPSCCFSGHETFPFRYPWLKKGFDPVCADGEVFQREDRLVPIAHSDKGYGPRPGMTLRTPPVGSATSPA